MSDSSIPVVSLRESNPDIESNLVSFFNKLTIQTQGSFSESSESSENRILRNCLNMPQVPILDMKDLSVIPNFDGNPNKLHRFISVSETILNYYFDRDNLNNFQNTLLINGILNKLEGRAEEVIAINGATQWPSIKNTLILNFGDQRDENCLNQDLVNLRQKQNETPYQFHERVIHLLNTICNYVDLHCDVAERQCKRNFFTKQALKTFLAGLREPLGPIIRAMRPTSLPQALQFISEEDNVKYFQKSTPQTQSNVVIKKPISNHPQNYFNPQFSQAGPSYFSGPVRPVMYHQQPTNSQFPRGPVNIQRHPNPPTQKYFTNSQVFGKPQNVWKPSTSNNTVQNKPTPMSVSTKNTTPQFRRPVQNNYFQNNAQRPKYVAEELFNTELECSQNDTPECSDEEEQSYEYSYPDNEQPENFQEDLYSIDET